MLYHVRDYGDGIAEVTWNTEIRPERKEKAERGKSENLLENRKRTLARATRQVVRKILWNRTDHLLTLTYRDEVTDIEQARRDRERFCDEVQAKIPGWRYLGVYEVQPKRLKRTGVAVWHSHLAVDGWQQISLLRETWRGIVGEGNIQVEPPRKRKGDPRLAMARYLGKYLTKAADEDTEWQLNRKIYFHSKNMVDPPDERIEVEYMGGAEPADMAAALLGTRDGGLVSVWESIDGRRGRVASFDIGGRENPRPQAHLLGEIHPLWTKAVREGLCRIGGRPVENTCEGRGSSIP
jgi:hypothetical protein